MARATLVLMFGFVASRLLGMARVVIFASLFGTSPEYSVYVAAFQVPDTLFQVLAGAVLGSAFLPTFTGYLARQERDEGWLLASSILNAVFVGTFCLSLVAWLVAPLFMPVLLQGYGQTEVDLGVNLTRIMLLSPIFFGVSGIVTGILNGQKHFLLPALAPVIYNLAIISGALLLQGPLGMTGLAIGVASGAFLHLAIQLPALFRGDMQYFFRIAFRHAGVREVGRLMVPRSIGLGAAQVNVLISTAIASTLSAGSIAALSYAWQIMMLPLGIFGMAISTAVFPTLAQDASLDRKEKVKSTLLASLRMILFLTVPASIGLIVLREPVIASIFERGAFGATSTEATSYALLFYALGLTGHGALEIVNRAFYALKDTRTPVTVSVIAIFTTVVLSLVLVRVLGHGGLALSLSLTTLAEAGCLLFLLNRRLGGLLNRSALTGVSQLAAGAAAMVLVLIGFSDFAPSLHWFGADRLWQTAVGILLGGITYIVAMWALRSEEIGLLTRQIMRRLN